MHTAIAIEAERTDLAAGEQIGEFRQARRELGRLRLQARVGQPQRSDLRAFIARLRRCSGSGRAGLRMPHAPSRLPHDLPFTGVPSAPGCPSHVQPGTPPPHPPSP